MRRKKDQSRRPKRRPDARGSVASPKEKYRLGLANGYKEGLKAGCDSYGNHFDGTSIIISCRNEAEYLKRCIESIMEHTELPYEVIVIDSGSTDHTQQYLKGLDGQVRYCLLGNDAGFVMSANRGLMMAKGTTMLLLSNRIIATEYWLENMLNCLNSDSSIGMVGPVSNGWQGNQHKALRCEKLEDMHELARINNVIDAGARKRTERLSKECLLFRRELLEKTGYLDEAIEHDSFCEEDYSLRVRLQGYTLLYTEEAYVHFATINSEMKELVEHYEATSEASTSSMLYFMDKWNNPNQILRYREELGLMTNLGEAAYYPLQAVVKGTGNRIYWIEDQKRRLIEGMWERDAVQLSQLDVRRWEASEPITAEAAAERLDTVSVSDLHGSVLRDSEGTLYYFENGHKREVAGLAAEQAWLMHLYPTASLSEQQMKELPSGLPIIAPCSLRQAL
ncbi:glycosyltransferase family 2 protein [Paenibacillus sp. YIM B09110]|uniref:glycosyltransferase family 2 protein n=1 Tax=Paenibacillus sp. YIM B09110 TaxID=3126102 RepID=UPI00301E533C